MKDGAALAQIKPFITPPTFRKNGGRRLALARRRRFAGERCSPLVSSLPIIRGELRPLLGSHLAACRLPPSVGSVQIRTCLDGAIERRLNGGAAAVVTDLSSGGATIAPIVGYLLIHDALQCNNASHSLLYGTNCRGDHKIYNLTLLRVKGHFENKVLRMSPLCFFLIFNFNFSLAYKSRTTNLLPLPAMHHFLHQGPVLC